MNTELIAARVRELEPSKIEKGWVSLSLCIVDAVWSIGVRYESVVGPLVRRVAHHVGIGQPLLAHEQLVKDPVPLSDFAARYPDEETLISVTNNRQRTSTQSGITKAAAILEHVRVFRDHDIETLQDAHLVRGDSERRQAIDNQLKKIKGEGSHGIRRNYLWMLLGDENLIKPDRRVMEWLQNIDPAIRSPRQAEKAVEAVADHLGGRYTPRQIDRAIWQAAAPITRLQTSGCR